MIMNTFKEDLQVGRVGENEFIKYCNKKGWEYVDISNEYETINADFEVVKKDGFKRYIEVKWDNRINESGNVFAETCSNVKNKRKGWLYSSDAEFVFYGDSVNRMFHVFRLKDLREYCEIHNPKEIIFNDWKNGKQVKGYLVNIHLFKEKGYKVVNVILP